MNPRVRRHKWFAGYLILEIKDVPWDYWEHDRGLRTVLCGELGHAEWVFYQIAWKVAMERIFQEVPVQLAERVGVELP